MLTLQFCHDDEIRTQKKGNILKVDLKKWNLNWLGLVLFYFIIFFYDKTLRKQLLLSLALKCTCVSIHSNTSAFNLNEKETAFRLYNCSGKLCSPRINLQKSMFN